MTRSRLGVAALAVSAGACSAHPRFQPASAGSRIGEPGVVLNLEARRGSDDVLVARLDPPLPDGTARLSLVVSDAWAGHVRVAVLQHRDRRYFVAAADNAGSGGGVYARVFRMEPARLVALHQELLQGCWDPHLEGDALVLHAQRGEPYHCRLLWWGTTVSARVPLS
jgi:hypothetical protein